MSNLEGIRCASNLWRQGRIQIDDAARARPQHG